MYVACFKNEFNSQLIVGHISDTSSSDCAARAARESKPYFGMERLRGSRTRPGNAQCLLLDALPRQSNVADSECEAETDGSGNLLGNEHRMAVYEHAAGL